VTGTTPQADLASARGLLLSRALASTEGAPVSVLGMALAAGGNSRETWLADIRINNDARRVVFRCDPDSWIRPAEMQREIHGLRLAARAGVPVPRVLAANAGLGDTGARASSMSGADIGRPYVVTEFLEGTALARRVMRDDTYKAAREKFATQCGEILARLHGAAALAEGWQPYDPIAELREYLSRAAYPSPVLQGAARWLAEHRPTSMPLVPVHRDFRLGNLMITPEGIVGVLDWETCQLSEPEEDLAWLCARSWRYGGEKPVGGLGMIEDLLGAYERSGGRKVDMTRFHWWSVFAETRWGVAATIEQRAGSTPGDAMEQAATIRRGCRQELNVLLELQRYVKS
jgi:aminoglycoside phosphotransferase (APT) family kinase protein